MRGLTTGLALAVATLALGGCATMGDAGMPEAPLRNPRLVLTTSQTGDVEQIEVANGSMLPYRLQRSCYGWRLRFDPEDGPIELVEQLDLPGPAPGWVSGGETFVNKAKTAGQTRIHADGNTGEAHNGWCVAQDDPQGLYRFTILHHRRVVGRVEFILGEDK